MDTSSNEKKTKQYTPIAPFDRTLHEDYSMYDHLVYTRDLTLFDNNEVMMNRGNVIHFFECKTVQPRKVGGDIIDVEPSAEEDIPEDVNASQDWDVPTDETASEDGNAPDDRNNILSENSIEEI